MDVKITLKNDSQQKCLSIFLVGIQFLRYGYLMVQKKNIRYTFCEALREHTMKMIHFKKKKMMLLTNEQQESLIFLLIILLKEFIKLNAKMDMFIKNGECAELNAKIVSVVWNAQMLELM